MSTNLIVYILCGIPSGNSNFMHTYQDVVYHLVQNLSKISQREKGVYFTSIQEVFVPAPCSMS